MTVSATQLPGNGRANVAKIQTKAKAFGVFNSPTDSQMIYVDPKHDNEAHHSPQLTEAEAKVAFERGLIEDPSEAKAVEDDDVEVPAADPNTIENIGAQKSEEFSTDGTAGVGGDVIMTRSTTAFPDADRVEGGAHGFADGTRVAETSGDVDTDSGDDDAPPAPPARRGRAAAPKTTS